jgi:hypothetical protein
MAKIDEATMAVLKEQACTILGLETLETRNSDRLDFHDTPVWSVIELIEMAYLQGHQQGQLDSH